MTRRSSECHVVAPVATITVSSGDGAQPYEVLHPLAGNDRNAVAQQREMSAPFKGKMDGPAARGAFDEVMEHTPDATNVSYETGSVGGVSGVWCRPANARLDSVILYLHGGAYVLGSAHAFRHFAGQIAARSAAAAFIAEYRLAPEHPFPAAVDDAIAAFRGLAALGTRSIAIVGDSAGGGLALITLSIAQSDAAANLGVLPSGAVAISPWTDLALTGASLDARAVVDPLMTRDMLAATATSYLRGHDARDPLASPLYGTLDDLPPVQLHVGTSEVLLDDARRYAARAHAAGVDAMLHMWEGMAHVFPASVGTFIAAHESLDMIGAFLMERLHTRSTPRSIAP